ncbi:unnamed protein product [Musa acuminata subsp. malaccensis]|uniref:(wild Malaysian banana) hypothetical protein n=1 Tax=Musa acuminata subsp. malaccensis TaxID=214687 RepID=A0A804IGK5_MUSAM|nr:unnamed protein product [Musa acuminata subsp. malaccensis]
MIYVNESNYLSFDLLENYFTKDIFVIAFVHRLWSSNHKNCTKVLNFPYFLYYPSYCI